MILTLVVIVLWVVMTPLLHPQPDKTVPPPADIAEAEDVDEDSVRAEGPRRRNGPGPADTSHAHRELTSRVNMVIGGIGLVYLVVHFAGLEEGVLPASPSTP